MTWNSCHIIVDKIKAELENLVIWPKGLVNNVSVRPPNLSLASCDDLWPPHSQSWSLPREQLAPIEFSRRVYKFANRQTNRQVEKTVPPPASLASWRHKSHHVNDIINVTELSNYRICNSRRQWNNWLLDILCIKILRRNRDYVFLIVPCTCTKYCLQFKHTLCR